jgi:transposase
MKAYSTDLCERVVAACQQGGRTIGEVAAQFSVSDSFVRKLRRRQRTSGSVAALPPHSGPAPVLNAAAQAQLTACLRQEPDATLTELCIWLAAIGGPAVSQTTLWRAVQALDWRRKKRVSTPPSGTPNA